MKIKLFLKIISCLILLNTCLINHSFSTSNAIVAKVGNEIITSIDVENEILTLLIINKTEVSQDSVNRAKNVATKELIRKLIKKNEIKKYNIKDYNKKDLDQYLVQVAERLGTSKSGLREMFKKNGISYDLFVDKYVTELLWNTLIFQIYKNQISLNTVEIENEVNERIKKGKKITEFNLSELEIKSTQDNTKIIEDIYNVIKNDGFEEAVKKYSISETAANNGKIGTVSSVSLSKIYLDKIKDLDIGEVSKPIISPKSIIFIKVNDKLIKNEKKNLDAEKIKNMILLRKKGEKLELFSRSHFSNLENTTLISFL